MQLDAGGINYFLNDELQSDLNYSGLGLKLQLQYDALTEKRYQTIYAFYSTMVLENKANSLQISGDAVNLGYTYRIKSDKLSFLNSQAYIGPSVKAGAFVRNKLSPQTGEIFGNLGVNYLLRKNIKNKHIIQAELDLALFTFLYYLNNRIIFVEPKFLFPNKLINYNFSLDYELASSKRFSFVARYHFNYFNHNHPVIGVQYGTHSLMIGAKFKLYKP